MAAIVPMTDCLVTKVSKSILGILNQLKIFLRDENKCDQNFIKATLSEYFSFLKAYLDRATTLLQVKQETYFDQRFKG